MGNFRFGSGYFGSDNVKTSTAMQEIIQQNKPVEWSLPTLEAYKFSFMNYNNPCHIILNNSGKQIYIAVGQGFETDIHDKGLTHFVVVEANITYSYVGAF